MNSLAQVKSELEKRLEYLVARQDKVTSDIRRHQDPDSEERAQEAENDEVLADLEAQGRVEIDQIRRALADIDAGRYGTCRSCGERIGEKRLSALPYAGTCIACAS